MSKWYNKWRIKLNERKTQAIYFTPRLRHKRPDAININNHRMESTGKIPRSYAEHHAHIHNTHKRAKEKTRISEEMAIPADQ